MGASLSALTKEGVTHIDAKVVGFDAGEGLLGRPRVFFFFFFFWLALLGFALVTISPAFRVVFYDRTGQR